MQWKHDVCVVGGCGRVGLPLALAFADIGLKVCVHDINSVAIEKVNQGQMPFFEEGADAVLQATIGKNLKVAHDVHQISSSENVVIIIGTPVDNYLNPKIEAFTKFILELSEVLTDGQLVILRSTVFPGTTMRASSLIAEKGKRVDLAFCPERVAEGKALHEFRTLPQIVSGTNPEALERASRLFAQLNEDIQILEPEEAELAKLFTNSWRYIQFAIANQFFMIAQDRNLDFYRIFEAMKWKYPRTEGFPKAGFAAGPCLFKDTMQLASYNKNNFFLGHAAMLINEGLPNFLVERIRAEQQISGKVVGILGMAFKADIDDSRDSLSFKIRKILIYEGAKVLCTDPFIQDPSFCELENVLREAEILILGTPHSAYRELEFRPEQHTYDVWNFWGSRELSER